MQKVKRLVIGVSRRYGVSKSSGRPYDMCQMLVGRENVSQVSATNTFDGVGFQTREVECDDSVIDQVRSAGFPLPAWCELSMDVREDGRGEPRAVVVGAELARPVSAAPSSKAAAG